MPFITREGRFRAQCNQFSIQTSQTSQSVGLRCTFNLIGEWHQPTKAWAPLNGLDTCNGTVWFIGKDGTKNQRGIDTLNNALAWDGNVDSLDGKTAWRPADCQVVVKSEEYKGKLQYKAQWINPWEGDGQPSKGAANKATPAAIANIKSIMSGLQNPEQGGSIEDIPF